MGESDESVFWDEAEDGYGGSFMSESFQGNQFSEPGIQSIYGEESSSKRIRISPEPNQQEGDADSSPQSSPLGLTLRKTPSFLSLLQSSLSKGKHAGFSTHDHKSRTKMDDLGSQSEKLKASNFPAVFIKIGTWQRITRHEGDLTAKLYYAKRKLVWEVLDGALKSKIEIQWSDIIAIRALTPGNEPGTLEIELNQPPLFYREINPQPRKHTLWQQASDFTGGQAPLWRRHHVRFPPGILDKHYEKLLQCDKRLLELSQKPFPSHESPYFDPTMFGISGLSLGFNQYAASGYPPAGVQYPYQTYPTTATGPPLQLPPDSSIPVMSSPFGSEGGSGNQLLTHQPQAPWGQSSQFFHAQNYYQPNAGLLNDIEGHLLGESRAVSSDHGGNLRAKLESMDSLLEPTVYTANYSGTGYGFADHSSADEAMQNARNMNPITEGLYAQHINWLPPQEPDRTIVTEQSMNSSLPPFFFPGNPTSGDFY